MIDFDTPIERRNTDSAKWHKYQGRDIIPLWVADMDFKSPQAVIDALHERIAHGVFGYPHPGDALKAAIRSYLMDNYHWQVDPQWIVWLPGLVSGLNVACRSVGKPGDAVLTTIPIYPPFLSAPGYARRRLQTTTLYFAHDRWHVDWDDLEKAVQADSALFLLCNPHNPTGRVFSQEELASLAQFALRHDLVICSDEIHCDLILEPGCRHIPIAMLDPEIARRTITLMAPSKTFNIPGLCCAYAIIANDHLRRCFKRAMAGIVPHINTLGLVAAQAALDHGKTWLQDLLIYLRENRDLVFQTINQWPGMHMGNVEATYLAWIDARSRVADDPVPYYEKAGVGLSDGREFGMPGFVRLNFGCSRSLLTAALDRMAKAAAMI